MAGTHEWTSKSEYHDYTARIKPALAQEHRLEKYEDRTYKTVFPVESWKAVHHGKYQTQWRGMMMLKDPFVMVIYQQLLWDVKPRTSIELGSYTGASAVWFADTMKSYGYESHVYSLDIDCTLLEPLAKEKRDDLTFVEGDCNKIEEAFTPDFLKNLPHPWFISEDAHVNAVNVLQYLDQFTQPGDYIVVEDTNPNISTLLGAGLFDDVEYNTVGTNNLKKNILNKFMKNHSDRYLIDKRYTDFFGYNGSSNSNGFLKRV